MIRLRARALRLLERPAAWDLLVASVAVALYARTVGYGWVYDDQMAVVRNEFIRSWSALPRIFGSTAWAGSGMETYLYRPLGQVTFLLNHTISGLEPWSYHLVNVVLFAGITVLVLRLGRAVGLPLAAAGTAALLFAVHPVHVEVVAAVHGRNGLLAAAFTLGLLLVHRQARREGGRRVALAVLFLACAVLSKETGVMALALVILLHRFRAGSWRALLGEPGARSLYAAYGGTLFLLFVVRMRVTGTLGVPETAVWDNPLVAADPFGRFATALAVLGRGVGSLFVPLRLSPDYSFDAIPLVTDAFDPRLVLTLVGMAVLGVVVLRVRRARALLLLACGAYLLALLPASNLVVLVGTIFGDRLLFLPSVAVCLAAGGGLHALYRRAPRVVVPLAAAWILFLGTQTARYTGAWTDDISLFEWAVRAQPASTKAHHKLGEEYLRVGRAEDALVELDRALAIAPDNVYAAATRAQAVRVLDGGER